MKHKISVIKDIAKNIQKNGIHSMYLIVASLFLFASFGAYKVFFTKAATDGWSSGSNYYSEQSGFSSYRGSPSTIYSCWADAEDSTAVQSSATDCMGQAKSEGWRYDAEISVGFMVNGESMSGAASGAYEGRWRSMAQSIRANWGNHRTVYIRPAHEMNGDWMPWSITNSNVGQFKQAWIRYYNIVQQELVQQGYNAKMVIGYNWGSGNSGVSIHDAWPGDQYVDVVSVDMYDVWWGTNPPTCINTADRWNQQLNWNDPAGNYGLNSWVSFAASHGKPLGFGEWALSDKTACDNPYWISQMNNWFRSNAGTGAGKVLYEIYFNVRNYGACNIYPQSGSESPNASATYKSLSWGNGGGGTSTPTGTTTPTPTSTPGADVSQTGNLLAGKAFSSSVADSTSESGHPASMMTDGNGSTRWISQPQSPVNATVDMGASYTLNKVSIKWAGDTIKNFQLQISANNSSWSTIYSGSTNNTTPQYVDYTSFSATPSGRYLRIVGTDRWNTSYGNSIWEVGAYGTSNSGGGGSGSDTTSPNVSILTPAAGASVNGSNVTITGAASDNTAVTKVDLLVDGGVKKTNSGSSANFTWDSKTVGDGSHTIALKAYDAAGNTRSASVTVNVYNTSPVPAPTIQSFSANPSSITVGQSTTLTWSIQNATSCSVTPGGPQGTTSLSWQTPILTSTGTRSYTVDCQNSNGQHTSKSLTITVNAAAQPPAQPTFVASATTVKAGSNVTLTWASSGATSCLLNPGNITVGPTASKVITNLNNETTYTLSCSNSAGVTNANPITIHVTTGNVAVADPTIQSFTAIPDKVGAGQSSTLSWFASNVSAGGCTIVPSPLVSTGSSGTWRTPALTQSASYTLSCVNSAGKTASKSVGISVDGGSIPGAPSPTIPPVNASDSTSAEVTASNGRKITNAAATDTVSGFTTFDPSNVTNSAKEQSIIKVEYYNGEELIQTVAQAPFALDTTKLQNGQYTITERTYFTDGSQSEATKVVTINNSSGETATSKGGNGWLWLLLILPLLGFGGFWFIRRRLMGTDSDESMYEAVIDPGAYENTYGQSYTPHTPDWQQGIAGPSVTEQPIDSEAYSGFTPQNPVDSSPFVAQTPDWQQGIAPTAKPESPYDLLPPNDIPIAKTEATIIANDRQYLDQTGTGTDFQPNQDAVSDQELPAHEEIRNAQSSDDALVSSDSGSEHQTPEASKAGHKLTDDDRDDNDDGVMIIDHSKPSDHT